MENAESVLLELEEFNRNNAEDKQIPQKLENFIENVAKTGTYTFPWQTIRKLYLTKLKYVLNNLSPSTATATTQQLNNTNDTSLNSSSLNTFLLNTTSTGTGLANESNNVQLIKERIIERMKSFNNAPFTIQRISELLLKPNSHYNRTDKFLRGLEKCVMVVTTIDPNGNKIFIENIFDPPDKISEIASIALTPVRPATPESIQIASITNNNNETDNENDMNNVNNSNNNDTSNNDESMIVSSSS